THRSRAAPSTSDGLSRLDPSWKWAPASVSRRRDTPGRCRSQSAERCGISLVPPADTRTCLEPLSDNTHLAHPVQRGQSDPASMRRSSSDLCWDIDKIANGWLER